MNKDATTQTYNLFVEGAAAPTGKSIVVKKGSIVEECGIVSLAPSTCNPKAQLATKQTYRFEDCIIEIELDPCTGDPGTPNVISGSCEVDSAPVGTLTVSVNGSDPEVVTLGEGWVSFGENSCTTTLISGLSVTTCTCTSTTDCTKKKSNGTYYCPESKYSICAPYQ
jgi:hypothetical protein